MSLKAKIEAIIYAAEEPVTLEQIAAVLGDAALPTPPPAPQEQSDEQLDGTPAETARASTESSPADQSSSPIEALAVPETEPGQNPVAEAPLLEAAVLDEKAKARKVKENLQKIIEELTTEYEQSDRAMEIRHVAGGYRMSTKPEHHDVIRAFAKSLKPPMKFSLQALETLAVIAYKQPVTAPEISEIRGVDCAGVLGGLISRKLITTAGRKQVIGRPILYKTTKDFLLRFGLNDLSELPSMEEFEKLASENTELLFGDEAAADAPSGPDTHGTETADAGNSSEPIGDEEHATETSGEQA